MTALRRPAESQPVATSSSRALGDVAAGRMVVLLDDATGVEYLVFAAQHADAANVGYTVRHSSGFVCVALTEERADQLHLPAQARSNVRPGVPDFAVAVDAADGIGTGISATDRAITIQLLGDEQTTSTALRRPGHVVPVRAHPDGLFARTGPAEAALDLVRAAGCTPAAGFAHLVDGGAELARVTTRELLEYRNRTEPQLTQVASARLPLSDGRFRAVGYASRRTGLEHLALVAGEVRGRTAVPMHLHIECVLGDVFGSLACNCAADLDRCIASVARAGEGVVIYTRTSGATDPHQASTAEHADVAAEILRDLGIGSVRLLDERPVLAAQLRARTFQVY